MYSSSFKIRNLDPAKRALKASCSDDLGVLSLSTASVFFLGDDDDDTVLRPDDVPLPSPLSNFFCFAKRARIRFFLLLLQVSLGGSSDVASGGLI